jgi:hypothetical protein
MNPWTAARRTTTTFGPTAPLRRAPNERLNLAALGDGCAAGRSSRTPTPRLLRPDRVGVPLTTNQELNQMSADTLAIHAQIEATERLPIQVLEIHIHDEDICTNCAWPLAHDGGCVCGN